MQQLHRCWIGVPLPKALLEAVEEAQMQIKRRAGSDVIRWVSPSEIALLLVPVGEVAAATMLRLETVLKGVATRHQPIELTLSGAGGSPNATMPKTAWIGLTGDLAKLSSLREDVAACITGLQNAIDEKPFEPVIEIGMLRRFDDRARTEMGRALKTVKIGDLGELKVDALHLLSSAVSPTGPVMRSMVSFPLS